MACLCTSEVRIPKCGVNFFRCPFLFGKVGDEIGDLKKAVFFFFLGGGG